MKAMTKLTFAFLSAMIVIVLLMIALAGCSRTTRPSQDIKPAKKDAAIENMNPGGSCTITIDQQTGKKQYECTLPVNNEKDQGR